MEKKSGSILVFSFNRRGSLFLKVGLQNPTLLLNGSKIFKGSYNAGFKTHFEKKMPFKPWTLAIKCINGDIEFTASVVNFKTMLALPWLLAKRP